ncbi:MAG: hypothetical protein EPN89_20165, partial [Methylovulum sp.]
MEFVADSFDYSTGWLGTRAAKESYGGTGGWGSLVFCKFFGTHASDRTSMKLGKAFSDTVIVEKRSRTHLSSDAPRAWWLGAGRALLFSTILFVVFFVLFFRLFSLTVVKGHEYRVLADGNRTRELIRHAPRGLLLDRAGKPLVANISQGLTYVRQYLYPRALAHVVGYTGELTEKELKDEYYSIRNYRLGDRVGRMGVEAVFEERLRGRDGRELVEVDASGN